VPELLSLIPQLEVVEDDYRAPGYMCAHLATVPAAMLDAVHETEARMQRAGQRRIALGRPALGRAELGTWTQDGDRYEFVLRGPLSGKSFRLSGNADGALLEGVDGGPLRGADAQTLLRDALGWDVPLRELRAWVLGLRADSGPAELSFGTDRLPAVLRQDGWVVDYRQWDMTRQPPLPQKVFAERAAYKVKLSIDSWQFP